MAMWLSVIRKLYDRIPDWAWPHLTGDAEPAPEDQDIFSVEHVDSLDEITSILSSRLVQLEERTRGVESKLLALLTLTSVLSTAVAASLAAATTLGSVKEDARLLVFSQSRSVRIEATHLGSGVLGGETPVDGGSSRVALRLIGADVPL